MRRIVVTVITQVRSILGIVFLVPFTVFCCIIIMCSAFLGLKDLTTKFVRGWGEVTLFIFGIKVGMRGEETLPQSGGGILVFNHQSLFDIPIILSTTSKHIRFGAKIELFKIPFFGPAMRAVGTLPIARDNRSEVMRIYKDAEKRFQENFIFVLAPEGTRQKEPRLGRFKKGPFIFAVNAHVPLIPVVIKGANEVLPKKSLNINVGRLTRTVAVEYLKPFETKGLDPRALEAFVNQVRTAMEASYVSL